MTRVSVVVPVYNEEGNIEALHREIKEVCEANRYEYEIIFVDDGSKDRTSKLAEGLKPLKYIRMRKNFGQTAAMDAGIHAAKYEYIVTMDGDRQNDPADIPRLIAYLEENQLDVVSGWRKDRKDTVMKKFVSRVANFLRGLIVKDNIHDSGCSLKIYQKECFEYVRLYGEMHRFIPALLKIKGFEVGEIPVNHRPRTEGVTKYNWKRSVKGFVDMISVWFWNKYAVRPVHLLGTWGLIFLFFGVLFGGWSVVLFFLGQNMSNTMQPFLCIFFVICGLLMFILGLMSDIILKTYYGSEIDVPYCIKEVREQGEQE